jgi:hypothetical protein
MLLRAKYCLAGLAAAVVMAACGSTTAPVQYQKINGQYTADFTYVLTTGGTGNPVNVPATMTLFDADRGGVFTGSFVITSPVVDTGGIAGQFASDGQTITWIQFGDGGQQPPFYLSLFLTAEYPTCNFRGATFVLTPGGGITGQQLTLAGTFSNFKCGTTPTDSLPGVLNASVQATNNAPPT